MAEFLDRVMQAQGPNSVPYLPEHKWNIRDQLVELQKVP